MVSLSHMQLSGFCILSVNKIKLLFELLYVFFLDDFLLISYFLRVRVAQTAVLVTVEDLSWNRYKFRQIYRDTNKWRQNAILLLLIFILS